MANVLHKTADPVDYRLSVNTPDFPSGTWFVNPDVSLVQGVPLKYWRRPLTDPVTEMTAPEKSIVDDADANAARLENRQNAVEGLDKSDYEGIRIRALIELFNDRDNDQTQRIIELQDRVQAMLDSRGDSLAMRVAGLAVPTSEIRSRTKSNAIQDFKDDINAGNQDT